MDIQLHYTEKGDGDVLVLLHGNGEDSTYFQAQIEYFSARYRVIAVDTRGHGASPRGTGAFTLERFACDLADFFDAHEIGKAHLLGFSDGANIALLFALKHPERLKSLILNGADLYPSGVKASVQIPIVCGYLAASVASVFDRRAVPKRELLGLMVREPHIKPASLGRLKLPVLVIVGTDDMIKDSHSRLIASSIPNARFVRIKGDHFIAAGNPAEFNGVVGSFLSEVDYE